MHESPPIYLSPKTRPALREYFEKKNPSSIFILMDKNTERYCLPLFLNNLSAEIPLKIIVIEPGEEHKTLKTCEKVWNFLSNHQADRHSLIINLGGGVVCDLGGFAASTFKRGIGFIHVPTSLLAMVDAAIGGKNGIDFGNLKNQIGLFNNPEMILVEPGFLKTLPKHQLKSGMAEIAKHGLIYRKSLWEKIRSLKEFTPEKLENFIRESIAIKTEIVSSDPGETGPRKILNFGHTLGHAIESHFLSDPKKTTLLHGEAVALGLVMECFISHKLFGFPKEELEVIKKWALATYKKIDLRPQNQESIIELLKHDKKNIYGEINFVLLEALGKPKLDCKVGKELILKSFEFLETEN